MVFTLPHLDGSLFSAVRASRRLWGMVAGMGVALLMAGCGGGGGGTPVAVVAPSLEMRSNVGGEATGVFTVTFDFSDKVTLANGQLPYSTTNGVPVAGSFAQLSTTRYAVQIQPAANRQGVFELKVPAGAFKDATGAQSSTVAYEFAQPINTIIAAGPEASWTDSAPADLWLTGPVTVTISFNEVLDAPLEMAKLQVSTGAISNFRKTSVTGAKDVYAFLYTPPAATQGGVTIELPTGAVASSGFSNSIVSWWSRAIRTP